MLQEKEEANVDELLAKAQKPSADALKLHPFYRGKTETALKCTVRDFNDFAIWYTPGVAAPCRAIEADAASTYDTLGSLCADMGVGTQIKKISI